MCACAMQNCVTANSGCVVLACVVGEAVDGCIVFLGVLHR